MKKIRSLFCVLLMAMTIVWEAPFTSHAQINAASDLRWLSDPGNFAFALNNTTGYVQVKLINRDSSFPYIVKNSTEISKFESNIGTYNFAKNIQDAGRYYVVVTVSESKDLSNGIDAISPDFNYTPPAELPTPTNLRWSTSKKAVAEWDVTGSVAGYNVQLYEDDEHITSYYSYRNPNGNVTSHDFSKYISDDTTKKYSFRVSALSSDILVAAHSQYSSISEIYDPSKVAIEEETKTEDNKTDQNISGNDNQQQSPEADKEETDGQKQDADTGNTDTNTPKQEETSENQAGVDVKKSETTVTKITLSKKSASLIKGNTLALKATVKPDDAKTKLTWKSSNSKIASVDKNGKVKALKKGTSTVTVSAENGTSASCKITVTEPIKVKSIKFAKKSYSVKKGRTAALKLTFSPKNATNKEVTYKTSNKKIATVDKNGKVKGIKKGKTTITVTTKDSKKKATCIVTVK